MELSGKRVFVTGADGFIGSHLVEALIEEGCAVTALAFYNSFNSWGWLDSLPSDKIDEFEVVTGDIRDPNGMRQHIKKADVVFHLAALIAIPFSYHSPDCYVDTNIKGTLNILQAARDFKVEKLLVASTSEVYGTADYVPIDEKHPRKGQSPYAATKIGADAIADSFWRSFQLPVVTVRPFNTYGPRQSARAIIPTIVTQVLSGYDEIRLGALSPTRDLVYVKDTVQGFIEIAKAEGVLGEEINIASQQEIAVGDLAQKIIELTNSSAKIVTEEERLRPENSEVERLLGSCEKLQKLTNWKQKYTFIEGLAETIEWFRNKNNLKQYKPDIYNL